MDKIGRRAVEAIENRAKRNGVKTSKERRKLGLSVQVFSRWKTQYMPSAYFLRQMALEGYDVHYILTGEKK